MTDLKQVYSDIHPHYETVNRIISLGMDRRWRRRLIRSARPATPGNWLDMCTGTGETAILLRNAAPAGTRVFAADYSIGMLHEFRRKPDSAGIAATLADAAGLPFPDASFQLVTTSFATRNLNQGRSRLVRTFEEFHRVLAPGGFYISIETSRPAGHLTDAVFRSIVRCLVEPAGTWLSGTRPGYAYLSRSIRTFHPPEILSGLLLEAGFRAVQYERLFFGAAAIHIASA